MAKTIQIMIEKRGKVTNGDMLKSIFPNAIIDKKLYTYCVCVKLPYHTRYDTGLLFDKDWWNAPYEREGEADDE